MNVCALILLALCGTSFANLDQCGPNIWNSLKVKWGPTPNGFFNPMPRTVDEATDDGFVQVSSCDDAATSSHRGARYVKDGDESVVLLFDKNGFIAGIQIVLPSGLPNGYPECLVPPYVKVEDTYYLTAYFVPPERICSCGRTPEEFEAQGTGTVLLIQNGPNPDHDYITIPLIEKSIESTKWVKGKYFRSMGLHYWHNISKDMSCDEFFPVFLLYNNGKLDGFGWAVPVPLFSKSWEHPPKQYLGLFIQEPPTCLMELDVFSTMHIFLASS